MADDKQNLADLGKVELPGDPPAAPAGGKAPTAPEPDQLSAGDLSQPVDDLGPALSGMLVITFGILARQRGGHWALAAEEAAEAGNAYAAVINKYFPEAKGGAELTAVLVTVALVGPRVIQDQLAPPAEEGDGGDKSE